MGGEFVLPACQDEEPALNNHLGTGVEAAWTKKEESEVPGILSK